MEAEMPLIPACDCVSGEYGAETLKGICSLDRNRTLFPFLPTAKAKGNEVDRVGACLMTLAEKGAWIAVASR